MPCCVWALSEMQKEARVAVACYHSLKAEDATEVSSLSHNLHALQIQDQRDGSLWHIYGQHKSLLSQAHPPLHCLRAQPGTGP